MSIRSIQTAAVLDEVTNALFASGEDPTVEHVLGEVKKYFEKYPPGQPLPMPFVDLQKDTISNVDQFNFFMLNLAMNLDTAYQASLEQIGTTIMLTTLLESYKKRLGTQQKSLSRKINDYMLSLYNTQGYYYSISDKFSDLTTTDLALTSAYIDTTQGNITIPGVSSLSSVVSKVDIGAPTLEATINGHVVPEVTVNPFAFAIDGLSNTAWEVTVSTPTPTPVSLVATISLGTTQSTIVLSEVNLNPYGVSPVEMNVEIGTTDQEGATVYQSLHGVVQYVTTPISFSAPQPVVATSARISFVKSNYDYIDTVRGTTEYVYVFGLRDLVFTEKTYGTSATWVSQPLSLPPTLAGSMVIDAVSLSTQDTIPPNTTINYYVALDPGDAKAIGDFSWRQILPIGNPKQNNTSTIVHFNGTLATTVYIESNPTSGNIALIPLDDSNAVLSKRNPSAVIFPNLNVYKIASFNGQPLLNSLKLEEGINSTRIYSTPYAVNAVTNLDFWASEIINDSPTVQYGEIDTGHGFFYGGDVGENGLSVYVETYLELLDAIPPIVDLLQKVDQNSQTWSVRAYLNGSEVGWLPGRNSDTTDSPVDSLLVPWHFNAGLNHIALTINIPPLTSVAGANINPYLGTLLLMKSNNLSSLGTVKLANWKYVDPFELQYNTVGTPTTFTILNSEMISLRQPTTNYRLSYNTPSNAAIEAIRLRADLARFDTSMNTTPVLNTYQVRFLYGNSA